MAITISNLRLVPYSQKDAIKAVWGNTLNLTFAVPHVDNESYVLGLDNDRVVYPPSRPLCALTNAFTRDGDNITMSLPLTTNKFRAYVSSIRKPMPVWIQLVRVMPDGTAETILLDDILALPSVLDAVNTVCEGDPLKELLDAKMDKPYDAGSEGQVLTMDADGHYAWADLPHIPEDPVQSDWDESDSSNLAYIRNKPVISKVGHTGQYNDLLDKPHIPVDPVQADYEQSDSSALDYIKHKPDLNVYVEKVEGKGLSTNDFTDADKEKLAGIAAGAEVNAQANWDESDSGADSYIQNKPVIPVQEQADWDQSDSQAVDYIKNKPVIPVQAQADWDESDSSSPAYILNKPEIGGDADTVQALEGLITVLEKYAGQLSNLDYFYAKCLEANGSEMTVYRIGNMTFDLYQVSLDRRKWYDVMEQITFDMKYGDKVYFRGQAHNGAWDLLNHVLVSSPGNFAIGGDMQSIVSSTIDHEMVSSGSRRCHALFINTNLSLIEEGFKLPVNVLQCSDFIRGTKVTSLPNGFTIPSTVTNVNGCFWYCNIASIGNNVSINPATDNTGNLDHSKITSIGTGFNYKTAYTTSSASGQEVFPNATIGSGWSIYQYTDQQ